jgi:N-acetylglucosaminyl-diphospho-decaprenol L-rhamnosyltransferase
VQLSYCVVNTNGRELLLACLEAIERDRPAGIESEVLVLDNASEDGSAAAVRELDGDLRLIELDRRSGKAANDSRLLEEARGEYCLLLNEDTELRTGASENLLAALRAAPAAAAAGARLLSADGSPQACAWRLPGIATAVAGALLLHRWLTVESRGDRTREVGWVQSSAMLVRREAAERVGWLDPGFFVYSDETDFCKRLRDAGYEILFVPGAEAVHRDQMASDESGAERRIVEYHRNRDRYLRKHKGALTAFLLRPLLALPYLVRAIGALALPGHSPRRYWTHFRQALRPGAGEGIREAAEDYNRRLAAPSASATAKPGGR